MNAIFRKGYTWNPFYFERLHTGERTLEKKSQCLNHCAKNPCEGQRTATGSCGSRFRCNKMGIQVSEVQTPDIFPLFRDGKMTVLTRSSTVGISCQTANPGYVMTLSRDAEKCAIGNSVRSVASVLQGKFYVAIKLKLALFLPKATTP